MLTEKYRPRSFSEVVAQDKAIARIRAVGKNGLGGRAFWITGSSGTGKTTIARLIAAEVADPFCTVEIDAGELNMPTLRDIERTQCLYGFGSKPGRAYIVNEAHGLKAPVIRALLVALEPIPAHVAWIFTTTSDGQEALFDDQMDAHPLLSRCTTLALSRQGLAQAFARHAQAIAVTEGLDGKPTAAYVRLVQDHHNNLRAAIQDIEAGLMLA
jgi:DNA polymerase III gamma/tau subunit